MLTICNEPIREPAAPPWRRLLPLLGVLLFSNSIAQAQSSVTLAWDPSPSTVAGYRLYQGSAPRTYSQQINCGAVTTRTVSNLTAGVTYYFAVVAYDAVGLESDFSNEIQYTAAPPAPTTPPAIVLSAPANGATYEAPASISLAASVSPNGHTISKVQFFNGATLLGEDASAPYSWAWSQVSAGTYSLRARAVYGTSSFVDSMTASVAVTASRPVSGLTFAADSGTITAPFVVSQGRVYQPSETTLANAGRAVYNFNVPATGNYFITADVLAPDGAANSFFVNVDAEPTDPNMIWDIPTAPVVTNRSVSWRGTGAVDGNQYNAKLFALTAGTHQLVICGREANTRLGTITVVPDTSLPAPWSFVEIGGQSIPGTATAANGIFTVSAAGSLGGLSDSLGFVWQPLAADGQITARINSTQNTDAGALAGVMIRELLTTGSRHTFIGVSPDGTVSFQRRTGTGRKTFSSTAGSAAPPNCWVRLVRTGSAIVASHSSDGVNWMQVGSVKVSMAANIHVGLAVASGDSNRLHSAGFGSLNVVP